MSRGRYVQLFLRQEDHHANSRSGISFSPRTPGSLILHYRNHCTLTTIRNFVLMTPSLHKGQSLDSVTFSMVLSLVLFFQLPIVLVGIENNYVHMIEFRGKKKTAVVCSFLRCVSHNGSWFFSKHLFLK